MRRGEFYASSGVTLGDVRFREESRTLEIDIEPEPGVEYTTYFIGTETGFDASSEPVPGEDGNPLPVTRRYSPDVGRILSEFRGTKPRYTLNGCELYVRAMVMSDQPPANPSFEGQRAQAWTQPVGWQRHVRRR